MDNKEDDLAIVPEHTLQRTIDQLMSDKKEAMVALSEQCVANPSNATAFANQLEELEEERSGRLNDAAREYIMGNWAMGLDATGNFTYEGMLKLDGNDYPILLCRL